MFIGTREVWGDHSHPDLSGAHKIKGSFSFMLHAFAGQLWLCPLVSSLIRDMPFQCRRERRMPA